jgi:flagellar basal body-associated protein FliL
MPKGSWLATIDETSGITQRSDQATIDFYPAPPNRRLYLILAIVLIVLLLLAAGLAVWLTRRKRRSPPSAGHLDDVMPPRPPVRTLRLAPPR